MGEGLMKCFLILISQTLYLCFCFVCANICNGQFNKYFCHIFYLVVYILELQL